MKELFEQRSQELSQGLDEQRQLIEQLQAQLTALASEHEKKSKQVASLKEIQEKSENLIPEFRIVLRELSQLDSSLLDSYIERINEVILGIKNSKGKLTESHKSSNPGTKHNSKVEATAKSLPETTQVEPELEDVPQEDKANPEQKPLFVEGQTVKVLTDKYNSNGDTGVIKSVIPKPNGFKYKVQLAKGLFTFNSEDLEESLEPEPVASNFKVEENTQDDLPF